MIINNLLGELRIMDDFNTKPNYSDLARRYKMDRHTIKKYHDNGGVPERKKVKRKSKWDEYYDDIIMLFSLPSTSKMAIFQSLNYKHNGNLPGDYSSFRSYTWRKNLTCKKGDNTPHVRYETDPGEQLQFDWVENLTIHFKNNESHFFHVFSATLGYSREHIYIYSPTKTTEDLLRCLLTTYQKLGGKTKKAKTDNMSAIVSIRDSHRKIHSHVKSFFDDLEVKLELCDVRTPETKGKCESANRFVKWIKAFDYQISNVDELISIIENYITSQCNSTINQSTRLPPAKLFLKEKDHLQPLGNKILLGTYITKHKRQKVPSTLLINYKNGQYSVPKKYIGKVVDIYVISSQLYIYYNSSLVTIHSITQNKINYNEEHYKEGLAARLKTSEKDINELAEMNLNRLKKLGGD